MARRRRNECVVRSIVRGPVQPHVCSRTRPPRGRRNRPCCGGDYRPRHDPVANDPAANADLRHRPGVDGRWRADRRGHWCAAALGRTSCRTACRAPCQTPCRARYRPRCRAALHRGVAAPCHLAPQCAGRSRAAAHDEERRRLCLGLPSRARRRRSARGGGRREGGRLRAWRRSRPTRCSGGGGRGGRRFGPGCCRPARCCGMRRRFVRCHRGRRGDRRCGRRRSRVGGRRVGCAAGSRAGGSRSGNRAGGGGGASRQHRQRVEVPLGLRGDPDAEVHVWLCDLGFATRADRADAVALGNCRARGNSQRAEMGQRDRILPRRGRDRDALAGGRHRSGERHGARHRREDGRACGARDVDAAVLSGSVWMGRVEVEGLKDGTGRRPRPGICVGRDNEHGEHGK